MGEGRVERDAPWGHGSSGDEPCGQFQVSSPQFPVPFGHALANPPRRKSSAAAPLFEVT